MVSMHVFIAGQVFGLQARSYGIDRVAEDVQSSGNVWGGKVCLRLRCDRANQTKSLSPRSLWVRTVIRIVGIGMQHEREHGPGW